MSDEKTEATSSDTSRGPNKALRSAAFLGVVAVVLGVFFYLSSLDAPPDLPKNDIHAFRFDAQQRLIGLKSETTGADAAGDENLAYDLKAVEKRINARCASCHGEAPGRVITEAPPAGSRVCEQMNAPCMPKTHPPKNTCIKCHRVGG